VAPLGHDFKGKVTVEATCNSTGSMLNTCKVCGYEEREEIDIDSNAHNWITAIIQVWSDEALSMVDVERIFCEICNMDKP